MSQSSGHETRKSQRQEEQEAPEKKPQFRDMLKSSKGLYQSADEESSQEPVLTKPKSSKKASKKVTEEESNEYDVSMEPD